VSRPLVADDAWPGNGAGARVALTARPDR